MIHFEFKRPIFCQSVEIGIAKINFAQRTQKVADLHYFLEMKITKDDYIHDFKPLEEEKEKFKLFAFRDWRTRFFNFFDKHSESYSFFFPESKTSKS